MTPFSLIIQSCGLSLAEAATLFDVRHDTVRSWAIGRRKTPDEVIERLRNLYIMIADAADRAAETISSAPQGADIEIGYPADDREAQGLGFPCVGAWKAMAGMVIAALDQPVTLVPRRSTPGTAAAADAHGK